MKTDQELEKALRGYLEEYVRHNAAARKLAELLGQAGVGLRPVIDHLTFRTLNVDRRAEEWIRYGFEHTETLEYGDWFAKVYRRDGYPALFIDQAFLKPRGEGSQIPGWVGRFGDHNLHHVAVLVEDIEQAMATLGQHGIGCVGEIIGRRGGPLRQIFTGPELRDGEPFTVLELTERHYGFQGFSPPQAQGLMESIVTGRKAA